MERGWSLGVLFLGAVTSVPAWGGTYLYVANQGDNSVSVIDTATDKVEKTVSGIKYPYSITPAPDGRHVAVTGQDRMVALIDTTTDSIVRTLSLMGSSSGAVFSPDGKLVYLAGCPMPVVPCESNVVSVLDTTSFTVIKSIPLPGGFWPGIAIDHDGRYLYVSNDTGVFVVDVSKGSVTKLSAIDSGAMSIMGEPDGHRVYVTGWNDTKHEHELISIDTVSNLVVEDLPLDVAPVGAALSPDGSRIYFSHCNNEPAEHCDGGFIAVFDTAKRALVASIELAGGTYPYGVAVSKDGAHVYVASDSLSGTVTVIDARSNTVKGVIDVGTTPFGVAVVSVPAAMTASGQKPL